MAMQGFCPPTRLGGHLSPTLPTAGATAANTKASGPKCKFQPGGKNNEAAHDTDRMLWRGWNSIVGTKLEFSFLPACASGQHLPGGLSRRHPDPDVDPADGLAEWNPGRWRQLPGPE